MDTLTSAGLIFRHLKLGDDHPAVPNREFSAGVEGQGAKVPMHAGWRRFRGPQSAQNG